MTAPRHIVWDWNGTLLDDLELTLQAVNGVLQHYGLPPIDVGAYQRRYARPLSRFYETLLGRPIEPENWLVIEQVFHDAYLAGLPDAELAEDAESTLRTAHQLGHGQSLLSMWSHDRLLREVERRALSPWFQRVDGNRGVGGGMKSDHLARHLQSLRRVADEVLVVGDALDDLDAARSIGAAAVLVSSGTHHHDELSASGVPVITKLSDVVNYL